MVLLIIQCSAKLVINLCNIRILLFYLRKIIHTGHLYLALKTEKSNMENLADLSMLLILVSYANTVRDKIINTHPR